ncbi:hypothetical protein DQ04_00671230 [Trypanosoma grayi]|uniref:hypothetical protein n=1 Tax=Trypanosoma grayi TaxID=71804 RepID=UPI0004F40D51|nr:hypothetical protein DQ04_00671230 [Trypanosoma grayi]KEG14020.1 hypothetical protein DQ04_00671230 [Trypanosoma grayi]
MSWTRALQAYLTSPPNLRHRDGASIFVRVARAHLLGPPGHAVLKHSLAILRQLRWEVLRNGTPEQKAQTLETVLACYANASRAYTYDPVNSELENHILGLEQLQSLVEARLAGVPMRQAHYRFLLQSPQLSQLGPNTPIFLLREMEKAEGILTDDIRVDVSVGLAAAGHWEEALQLSPRHRFEVLIRKVAASQRQGWRRACALVSHIESDLVTRDENILVGVTAVLALLYTATHGAAIVRQMELLIKKYSCRHGGKLPPRRAIENLLASCPPDQWRVATSFVMNYNSEADDADRIHIGKLMTLLNAAYQWEQVLHLYQATQSIPTPHEGQQATINNCTLAALVNGNLWQQAIQFYITRPVQSIQTHMTWLKNALFKSNIPFTATWVSCVNAYEQIAKPDHRYAEALAHRLGAMGEWITALNVVKGASKRTPHLLLTAISAAALASNDEALCQAAKELGASRHEVSAKQLCMAAAIVTCCTEDAPPEVSDVMADGLHNCTTSQQQFDDAVYHLGRCMALLLYGATRNGANRKNIPPALSLLMSSKQVRHIEGCWVFALTMLQKTSAKGWALTSVAPVLLSSGLDAAIAIHFLPD